MSAVLPMRTSFQTLGYKATSRLRLGERTKYRARAGMTKYLCDRRGDVSLAVGTQHNCKECGRSPFVIQDCRWRSGVDLSRLDCDIGLSFTAELLTVLRGSRGHCSRLGKGKKMRNLEVDELASTACKSQQSQRKNTSHRPLYDLSHQK